MGVFHCEKEGAIIGPRGPWLEAVEINVDTDLVSVEISIGRTYIWRIGEWRYC